MTVLVAPDRESVAGLVTSVLRDVLSPNGLAAGAIDETTPLIGRESPLDSLGLVTLIVDLEQRLAEEHGLHLILADDRAMSQRNSPFRSVGSLTEYVCRLLAPPGVAVV
jgi:acyl carrier protein